MDCMGLDLLRVLCQLMHIDDVGHGSELVDGPQHLFPLDPAFPGDEKEDSDAEKNEKIGRAHV